jgi:hypothetical protein
MCYCTNHYHQHQQQMSTNHCKWGHFEDGYVSTYVGPYGDGGITIQQQLIAIWV